MVGIRFEKGKNYWAHSTMDRNRKLVLACTGRRGSRVTFARVEGVYRSLVDEIDGRETALVLARDGLDYFTSSATEVDVDKAAEIMAAVEGR